MPVKPPIRSKPHHGKKKMSNGENRHTGESFENTMPQPTIEEIAARYEAVIASTLDPVVTINAHGIILSVSNSIERVFGWKPEEVIGENVTILMPEPHRSKHDDYMARYRQTGITQILGRAREFRAMRKDGTVFPIELAVARVELPENEAEDALFTGIIRDITTRKKTEEELARYRKHLEALVADRTHALEDTHERLRLADRLASIGTLAAGLGHDMDNVLFPTKCRLDAMESSPELPERMRKEIGAIRQSINFLQRLTDSLRLFALDPNDPSTLRGITEVRSWWEQVHPLLSRTVPKNAELLSSITDNLPPVAVAPHQLTQAVLNLVVNAGEALDNNQKDGFVRFWVDAFEDRKFVRIGVSDNGCGMTEEVRKHALEPFFTRKTRELSTGLGLSMVHGVSKSAGGSVEIDSQPGEGTTIIMTLPAVAHRQRPGDDIEDHIETVTAGVTMNNSRIAAYTTTLLKSLGFSTYNAETDQPGASNLWVIGYHDVTPDIIERYLAEGPGRHVVVYGAPARRGKKRGRSATADGHPKVTDVINLDGLREALRELASTLIGASS